MNTQLALPLSRSTDPVSSKRAALRMVVSGAVEGHESIIIELVRQYPGRTAKQLSALCSLSDVQINRRGKGMEAKGLVRRTAEGSAELKWWAT